MQPDRRGAGKDKERLSRLQASVRKGIPCFPAEPKPAKLPQPKRESWTQDFLTEQDAQIRICVFKRGKRAYVYVKPFTKENGERLEYVGAASAENVWRSEQGLTAFLKQHGYCVLTSLSYRQPEKPTNAPSKPSVESEEEWVGYELEAGDPQSIRDRYWDVREFLEACPNDEETAREIYGDDEVDDHLGKKKRSSSYDEESDEE